MSKRAVLEVIALDVEDAVAAQAGGADRLELVTDMAADGLTPAASTVTAIRAAVDIPARVMIRLADGFAAGAVERLVAAAREMREAGAEEFVLGFLDADGQVDLAAVERVAAELEGCRWTFHRAIDHATDRDTVRKQLADFPGLDTYLTAGSAEGGRGRVGAVRGGGAARGAWVRAAVAGGGGLRLEHVPGLLDAGVDAFHIGARRGRRVGRGRCRRRPWLGGGRCWEAESPLTPGAGVRTARRLRVPSAPTRAAWGASQTLEALGEARMPAGRAGWVGPRRVRGGGASVYVNCAGNGAPCVMIRPDTARVRVTYRRRRPVRSSGSASTIAWGSSRRT